MLVQIILENEFGLSERIPNNLDFFHTPNTTGLDGGSNSRKALKKRMEQWPTPDANCGKRGTQPEWTSKRKSGHPAQYTINQAVRDRFPTPQASDNRDRGNMSNPSIQRRIAKGKQIMLSQSVDQNSGQLNPMWVEWLMGWPIGWTDLKPLEMDKCHFVQQQLGNCLEKD
jgi:DNA (cytosine-5)-methyltransferase 1